jgi:hypothetical protein
MFKKILQVRGLMVILSEREASYRQIFTDGRPLPVDPTPSWNGYSSGKWEGDTLVVRTAGFRDDLWLDSQGSPLTSAATVTERFRRPNFGKLEIEITVDDPKAYTAPWTIKLNQPIVLDTELLDYICAENEKDAPHFTGKYMIGFRESCLESAAGLGFRALARTPNRGRQVGISCSIRVCSRWNIWLANSTECTIQ